MAAHLADMIRLEPHQYDLVRHLFTGLQLYPHLPFCIIEGKQPGWILVDDDQSPTAAFVGHRTGYSYLGGESETFASDLEAGLAESTGLESFDLCPASSFWADRIQRMADWQGGTYKMNSYRLDVDHFRSAQSTLPPVPEGCQLLPITVEIIQRVKGLSCLAFFETAEAFVEDGVGSILLAGDELASSCVTSFVGDGTCDASLVTADKHQRRGHATLVSAAFIASCLERGIEPIWHTTPGNVPSDRIAQKLGYELLGAFLMQRLHR